MNRVKVIEIVTKLLGGRIAPPMFQRGFENSFEQGYWAGVSDLTRDLISAITAEELEKKDSIGLRCWVGDHCRSPRCRQKCVYSPANKFALDLKGRDTTNLGGEKSVTVIIQGHAPSDFVEEGMGMLPVPHDGRTWKQRAD